MNPQTPQTPGRVLMTADAVGGVWRHALTLARGLSEAGSAVRLAVMGPPPSAAQRTEAGRIPGLSLVHGDFALEWMDDPWADVARAGDWLLDEARTHGAELVHLNGYAHGALDFGVPTVVVGHSCVLSWWRAVKGEDAPPRYDPYRRAVRAGLREADAVVAPTAAMGRALAALYDLPRLPRVIHNGLPEVPTCACPRAPEILAAGRLWDEGKHLDVLGPVGARLSWPVRVAGDPRGPDGRVRRPEGVEVLGPLEPSALDRAMRRAAVFVHPARYEPFGLAPLEAAARGCALVLSDLPSLREVWGDAAVYAPSEPDALVRALADLIEDVPRRRRLAEAARRRALRYRASAMIDDYLGLYARLRAGVRPAAAAARPGISAGG